MDQAARGWAPDCQSTSPRSDLLTSSGKKTWTGLRLRVKLPCSSNPHLWWSHDAKQSSRRPARSRIRSPAGAWRDHRAQRLDAGTVPEAADPDDVAARALRDRGHAPGRELDHPRAEPAPQDVAP